MAALDTNVLVRWLTADNEAQCAVVSNLLEIAAEKEERFFVPVTVILETEWVLRSRYRFDKPTVTAALDALMGVSELEFQSESALEQAGAPDFADCLHLALVSQAGQGPLLTFDERAGKLDGVQLLCG